MFCTLRIYANIQDTIKIKNKHHVTFKKYCIIFIHLRIFLFTTRQWSLLLSSLHIPASFHLNNETSYQQIHLLIVSSALLQSPSPDNITLMADWLADCFYCRFDDFLVPKQNYSLCLKSFLLPVNGNNGLRWRHYAKRYIFVFKCVGNRSNRSFSLKPFKIIIFRK